MESNPTKKAITNALYMGFLKDHRNTPFWDATNIRPHADAVNCHPKRSIQSRHLEYYLTHLESRRAMILLNA